MANRAKAIFFDLGETLVTQNIEDSMVTRNALQEISKILPKPVSPETLFRLYMKGYKTNDAIRSEYNVEIPIQAWMRRLLKRVTEKERLARYFDLIVTSTETGIRKPDPGIFRYALYQLNIRPEEAIMVGDSERHDIQGGYIAGLRTVLVNRKKPPAESLADYRFKTLGDAMPTLQSL